MTDRMSRIANFTVILAFVGAAFAAFAHNKSQVDKVPLMEKKVLRMEKQLCAIMIHLKVPGHGCLSQ